jgi:arylsulfatase
MATFVDITGASYPESYDGHPVLPTEGKSLLPIFKGKKREQPNTLCWKIGPGRNRAIRQGDWKLVSTSAEAPWELYNLKTDRVECENLAKKHPDKVKELAHLYVEWEKRVGKVKPKTQFNF